MVIYNNNLYYKTVKVLSLSSAAYIYIHQYVTLLFLRCETLRVTYISFILTSLHFAENSYHLRCIRKGLRGILISITLFLHCKASYFVMHVI